jgi:hypothetical protein
MIATGTGVAAALMSLALAAALAAGGQDPPAELSALTAKAGLDRPAVAWCRGEFQVGRPGAFAVAVGTSTGGGRYLVLAPGTATVELASFTGSPDLSCYTRAEAEKLHATIVDSVAIHGQLTPRWATTVICGFVDNTSAVCWQRDPASGAFVRVGGWIT